MYVWRRDLSWIHRQEESITSATQSTTCQLAQERKGQAGKTQSQTSSRRTNHENLSKESQSPTQKRQSLQSHNRHKTQNNNENQSTNQSQNRQNRCSIQEIHHDGPRKTKTDRLGCQGQEIEFCVAEEGDDYWTKDCETSIVDKESRGRIAQKVSATTSLRFC